MRLGIGHPDFVYTPLSEETRARMSASHRRRLGIPEGFRKLFGQFVNDDENYERLKKEAYSVFHKGSWYYRTRHSIRDDIYQKQFEKAGAHAAADNALDFDLMCELFGEMVTASEAAEFFGISEHHAELKIKAWREELRRQRK